MDSLKLVALDAQDLEIVSAHVQDAVMKAGDLTYLPGAKQFVVAMNRFAWESKAGFLKKTYERRKSVLHFDRVLSAKASRMPPQASEDVLSLLTVTFSPHDAPAGSIDLVFSGGGAIRLEVECIEARLADTGGAWAAASQPVHKA